MEKEFLLDRVVKVVGRAFSGSGRTIEMVSFDGQAHGLVGIEGGEPHRTSKFPIPFGQYIGGLGPFSVAARIREGKL